MDLLHFHSLVNTASKGCLMAKSHSIPTRAVAANGFSVLHLILSLRLSFASTTVNRTLFTSPEVQREGWRRRVKMWNKL